MTKKAPGAKKKAAKRKVKKPTDRPAPRVRRMIFNVDEKTYQAGVAKAGSKKRLNAIQRVLLSLWTKGELEDPEESEVMKEMLRAAGGGRKKKKQSGK